MIELQDVGVRFSRIARRERTLNRLVHRGLTRLGCALKGERSADVTERRMRGGFWALKGVNLRIQPGESVGLVGVNGAGKSTLLQVIAGIYAPTAGHAEVQGLVSALLGLNTGFNIELTGLDNIRLSGLLLGLSNERIDALVPEIIRFSELEDFIDQPVRTYSSGMSTRLGFAISTAVAPDVLLLDEVMGVGDGAFKERSTAKLRELMDEVRVLCLCSHSLPYIRERCERVVWLDHGRIVRDGPCEPVLEAYEAFLQTRVSGTKMARSA